MIMSLKMGVTHFGLLEALGRGLPPPGNLAVPIFSHGSIVVELYSPTGTDRQQPHSRDELYFVARGTGTFFDGQQRRVVQPGSFLFVPAGQAHRFEDFTEEFVVWVVFYGPEGGEMGRLEVRPYVEADLTDLVKVYGESVRTLGAPFYDAVQLEAWAPSNPDEARWRERFSQLETLVGIVGGTVAGFVSYTREGYVDFLFTSPVFARRGVATTLYGQAEVRLKSYGVEQVTTHSSLAARDFFERRGFCIEGAEIVECRGARLQRFQMKKAFVQAAF